MPLLDPRERSIPVLPVILVANILPLIGVIYYDLSFFALFYLFWWETAIISFYQWVKMGRAEKKSNPDPNFKINGKPLTHEQVNSKRYMRRNNFTLGLYMLLVYLMFIIVFVGIIQENETDHPYSFLHYLFLLEPWMIFSVLAFIITHGLEYWVWVRDREYKNTSLLELGLPFSARMMLMHIVIVIGGFGSMYASESLFPDNPKAGTIAYAVLFVFCKILLDVYSYSKNKRKFEVITALTSLNKSTDQTQTN